MIIGVEGNRGYLLSNGMLRHANDLLTVQLSKEDLERVQKIIKMAALGKTFYIDDNGDLEQF